MNPTFLRKALTLVAAVALLGTGCAKKGVTPPAAPPTSPPTSTTPTPVPNPITPPVATPGGTSTATVADLKTIYFALDSYLLDDAARAGLDANAKILRDNAALRLKIEGYCDERGTVEYNEALGQKRADAVREYLIGSGVSGDRLTAVTLGEEFPVDDGHDESAWARNRRAEFKAQ